MNAFLRHSIGFYSKWDGDLWRILNRIVIWFMSMYLFAASWGSKFLTFFEYVYAVTSCLAVNFYLHFPGSETLVVKKPQCAVGNFILFSVQCSSLKDVSHRKLSRETFLIFIFSSNFAKWYFQQIIFWMFWRLLPKLNTQEEKKKSWESHRSLKLQFKIYAPPLHACLHNAQAIG